MKNQIVNFVIATGFAALIANTPAAAQNPHKATIPFTFVAGHTECPSGEYELRLGTNSVLRLTNVATGKTRMFMLAPGSGIQTTSPKLVFQATDEGHRLSEVWLDGSAGMKTFDSLKRNEAARVTTVAIR